MTTYAAPQTVTIPVAGGALLMAQEYLPEGPVDPDLPTLVLTHGWTLNRNAWRPVIEALHATYPVRIIAYDHRGHGESTMGEDAEVSVRELGRDLHEVISALAPEGPLVLAGHSMGGMTIMAFAGQFHTVLQERVRGVTLVATAASVAGRKVIPLESLVMGIAKRAPQIAPGWLVPTAIEGPRLFGKGANKADMAETVAMIQQCKMPTIGRYFEALSQHDEVSSLAHFVDVPTHVISGTADKLTPSNWGRRIAEGIPGSRFTELPDLGHMIPYEATDVVTDSIAEHLTA